MNILIPDFWLREYLETDATPKQIKEYLSLCGPSVERIHKIKHETVYDIEITSNRPDSMSILGIAREAAAILPRFGIEAKLVKDPYINILQAQQEVASLKNISSHLSGSNNKQLNIFTDPALNPRWVSIVIDNVSVKPSPKWLQKKLELTSIRPLNTIVDVTNYFMRAFGQPAHAFDYDKIKPKNDVPTMVLRAAKKGEKITTLDGKTHILPGGDIVIEDGSGRLIDLAGIMGAENSSIKEKTKTIVLFMQTYDPVQIRKTVMNLSHRTEAASLFEKGLDEELALPTILEGIEMIKDVTGGTVASNLYDIYPKPYTPYTVSVSREKVDTYIGKKLADQEIIQILTPLGFKPAITSTQISVAVPSFRRDIEIDVDVIEEIARIYGYHNIKPTLPDTAPPVVQPDPELRWEEEIKVRLRDWGFTETYTYSMISEELMDQFGLDKKKVYRIANPLSNEWVYMRPTLWPSFLKVIKENLNLRPEFKLFELSMRYVYRNDDLPSEAPTLLVGWTGERFYEAKGLAEALFDLFGIPIPNTEQKVHQLDWYINKYLDLGVYGSLGVVNRQLLQKLEIKSPLTILELEFGQLVKNAQFVKKYRPIPKYPPVIEDMSFIFPEKTPIGNVLHLIKDSSSLVHSVNLLNQYQNTSTFRIFYLDRQKPLTDDEVKSSRVEIKEIVEKQYAGKLKV